MAASQSPTEQVCGVGYLVAGRRGGCRLLREITEERRTRRAQPQPPASRLVATPSYPWAPLHCACARRDREVAAVRRVSEWQIGSREVKVEVEDRRTRPSGAVLVPCRARRLARDETCRKPGRPKLRLKLRRWQRCSIRRDLGRKAAALSCGRA